MKSIWMNIEMNAICFVKMFVTSSLLCVETEYCWKTNSKKIKNQSNDKSFTMMKTIELIKDDQRVLNFILWICWKNCSLWPENWLDELWRKLETVMKNWKKTCSKMMKFDCVDESFIITNKNWLQNGYWRVLNFWLYFRWRVFFFY